MSSDLAVQTPDAKWALATKLAASEMLPRAFQKNPANLLWAIEYGAALGVSPVVAIGMVHIMDGKPVASATLIGALVRHAGHILRVTADDTKATATIIRKDDPSFAFEVTWTLADAKRAGIDRNPTWGKYPKAMLIARATAACARMACPEALAGLTHTPEEMGARVDQHGAPVEMRAVTSDWTGPSRVIFEGSLAKIGASLDTVTAWCVSLGKPVPADMTDGQRRGLLRALESGPRRDEYEAFAAGAVDVEFETDTPATEPAQEPK